MKRHAPWTEGIAERTRLTSVDRSTYLLTISNFSWIRKSNLVPTHRSHLKPLSPSSASVVMNPAGPSLMTFADEILLEDLSRIEAL
jgi:hypothetical protein